MVNSRDKGYRAEIKARDMLREVTGLKWERTPLSGALSKEHKLKGDLYIPEVNNKFCIEVKHYKEDNINSKLLTSSEPVIFKWWIQATKQAQLCSKRPLLLFKFDFSKWFVGFNFIYPAMGGRFISMDTNNDKIHLQEFTNWYKTNRVNFINE